MLAMLKERHFLDEMYYENLYYHPVYTKALSQNKCKCKESRAAAYQLLQAYFESLDPKELSEFLDQYLWPFIKDVNRPKRWQYQPNESFRMQTYVGITNLGCICYMNSMLQQFFMVPAFRY